MKKLLFILFLIIGISSQAQNYVGFSKKEVKTGLNAQGESYTEDLADNGVPYISFENRISGTIQVYYFNQVNICVRYIVFYRYLDYATLVNSLNKEYKRFGDKWYGMSSVVELKYDYEFRGWLLQFDISEL